jgi:hypothetical protein
MLVLSKPIQTLKQFLGTNTPWGFLPLYFCLLTLSLLISNNVIYSYVLGHEPFILSNALIDYPYFKLGFQDIWYPIFTTTIAYFISKIKRINLLGFFLVYFIIDFAHNCLYFYITNNQIYNELWFIAYYNACRFGLLFVFVALLSKKLKYYLFIIPIAFLLSDQIAFWSEFLTEVYVFFVTVIIKWNPIYQVILYPSSQKLLEGLVMAIVYGLTKKIMASINTPLIKE